MLFIEASTESTQRSQHKSSSAILDYGKAMEQAETQAAKLENGTKDDVNRLSRGRNINSNSIINYILLPTRPRPKTRYITEFLKKFIYIE